jgi:hypothetical protein
MATVAVPWHFEQLVLLIFATSLFAELARFARRGIQPAAMSAA